MKILAIALAGGICWAVLGCQERSGYDNSPARLRFVIGIDHDFSLNLDRRAISAEQLAKEWPRLASQVREKAAALGNRLEGRESLPAVIVIWAADESPYSVAYSVMREAHKSGFEKWIFIPKSRHEDPFLLPVAAARTVRADPTELPEHVRTIPIRLLADDRGDIGRLLLGDETELENLTALESELGKIQDDPDTPFDRALLAVDPKLKFSEFARVAELLCKQRITTMSFIETRPGSDD
jgi:biopolymer transport protein ExbD